MLMTTLNRIRAHGPCVDGWRALLDYLGKTAADDEPLSFETILASNGLDDALWCLRAEPQYAREYRLLAVWFARQVQHLMTDPRSLAALDVAERHANGGATDAELAAAWDAAWDAAEGAAASVTHADAGYAAWATARIARAAAKVSSRDASWRAVISTQRVRFFEMINEIEP